MKQCKTVIFCAQLHHLYHQSIAKLGKITSNCRMERSLEIVMDFEASYLWIRFWSQLPCTFCDRVVVSCAVSRVGVRYKQMFTERFYFEGRPWCEFTEDLICIQQIPFLQSRVLTSQGDVWPSPTERAHLCDQLQWVNNLCWTFCTAVLSSRRWPASRFCQVFAGKMIWSV